MPSQRNSVLTDRGDVRASKLIGSSVYNDRDEKVGSVDDIVLGKDNRADEVVVSVGGFLGIGTKLVAVPYSQLPSEFLQEFDRLSFEDARRHAIRPAAVPGARDARTRLRIVPGSSGDQKM